MKETKRKHWVLNLPRGLREQPGWVFIGTSCSLSGATYMFGVSESSVTRVLNENWLQVWGAFFMTAGLLVVVATVRMNRALEKLALRMLSLCLFVYIGWIVAAVPFHRATLIVSLCISLIVLSEIRVAVLRILLNPLPISVREERSE